MMRLDKMLADFTELTRSQAKKAVRDGEVCVNGELVTKSDVKISETDKVSLNGQILQSETYQYIMLNKPVGILSSTKDNAQDTVIDWIRRTSVGAFLAKDLFPMGRLDKDTEGLLIITNDGPLSHRLLSPAKHVDKTYYVVVNGVLDETDVESLKNGIDIGEKRITKPGFTKILSDTECELTITEGKFHQVKRMFQKLGKPVVYLKRIRMAGLCLDDSLLRGEWRMLTEEEIQILKNAK